MTNFAQFPVFDGHNDLLCRMHSGKIPASAFLTRGTEGQFDLPRMKEANFWGGMFAVWVPPRSTDDAGKPIPAAPHVPGTLPPPLDTQWALRTAISCTALLARIEKESNGQLKMVRTYAELEDCLRRNVVAAVLHFEGAEPIDTNFDALEVFYRAGLRALDLTWSRPNDFATGVPVQFLHSPDVGPGLSDAGKELVKACNRIGIVVDVAHVNEKGVMDAVAASDAPIVASHACAWAISPVARNLTDREIDAIAESGGVIGVDFITHDLREDGQSDLDTPISQWVRHVDYIAERVGIDHVAFGSDFDGTALPTEIGPDVTGLPKVVAALAARGYDGAAMRKITHENWLRVFKQVWKD
jgi:membrane dipeptidase